MKCMHGYETQCPQCDEMRQKMTARPPGTTQKDYAAEIGVPRSTLRDHELLQNGGDRQNVTDPDNPKENGNGKSAKSDYQTGWLNAYTRNTGYGVALYELSRIRNKGIRGEILKWIAENWNVTIVNNGRTVVARRPAKSSLRESVHDLSILDSGQVS
jgi:hypothetical protein